MIRTYGAQQRTEQHSSGEIKWTIRNFKSPPLPTRMNHGFPQKLLTFSRQYGSGGTQKSRNSLFQLDFFELAQSGGSEQNSVSIALKPLYEGAFFKVWSGGDQEEVNQINSLSDAVERLKI